MNRILVTLRVNSETGWFWAQIYNQIIDKSFTSELMVLKEEDVN